MAQGMYIEGRKIKQFSDIQRNYNYEITFQNASSLVPEWGIDGENVTLRVQSFVLPQRGNEAIETNFGAMKQFHVGKPTFGNTVDLTFVETESQSVQRFLYAWQQRLFDIRAGHGTFVKKRGTDGSGILTDGYCDLAYITAYTVGNNELVNKYWFINTWLQNVGDVTVDYSQAGDAIKFTSTFQFDFWDYGPEAPQFDPNVAFTAPISTGNPKDT